jgi:hypothetical protein
MVCKGNPLPTIGLSSVVQRSQFLTSPDLLPVTRLPQSVHLLLEHDDTSQRLAIKPIDCLFNHDLANKHLKKVAVGQLRLAHGNTSEFRGGVEVQSR